jgi:hypothetical protein
MLENFELKENYAIGGYRECLIEIAIPEMLKNLKSALSTIPFSSSKCERGFSQMNLIVSSTTAFLITNTISSVRFLKIVGTPLTNFDAAKYVDSSLFRNHHSATETDSKERNRDVLTDEKVTQIWSFL